MGTTLTALQAGSTSYVYVACIEGCKYLLTNGSTTAALTAWAAQTDFTLCLDGLYVEAQHDQQINPWEPFNSGGKCVLTITQDAADTFGVYTHRKGGGDETLLTVELDRNDTTVEVKSTTAFDATGEIHIGTECIAYTGKTPAAGGVGGKFTGCTRGKYSPFAADGSEATRFANHHRVGFDANTVKLQPVVSSIPRIWAGRRIGIWVHRVVGGVLDVLAQAHLVYAGRIVDIRDDPGSIATVIECEHILDEVKEGTLGRDLWSCKAKAGILLEYPMVFTIEDENNSGVIRTANALNVSSTGTPGPNQIAPGFYTHAELFSKLETWWTAEKTAGRLWGTYRISIQDEDGWHTKLYATIPATPTGHVHFRFRMPVVVAKFWGYSTTVAPQISGQRQEIARVQPGDSEEYYPSDGAPLRSVMFNTAYNGAANLFDLNRFEFYDERGKFFDQIDYWPGTAPTSQNTYANRGVGIFLIDGKFLAHGVFHATLDQIGQLIPMSFQYTGNKADLSPISTTEYDDGTDFIDVRQVLILEAPLWELMWMLFYSSGTAGYNHATHDILPAGCGLGLPADLLGIDFEASAAGLPGASNSTVVIIDEPTTFADLFGGDFVLRRAFTLWKEGHVKFGTWRAPTTGDAIYTLAETNKAEPAGGDNDSHRSATAQSTEWARSVVKIDYNRDITALEKDGGYRDSITFEDSTAVDDAGGRSKLFTIKARHTYGQYAATGVGVNSLAPGFLAFLPMVSRPAWKIRRSIDCRYFEGLSVGDVVLFTDAFARDPITGTRGITARPAIVTMHKWGFGGAAPGADQPDPMGGEVELFFTDVNPTLQSAKYAPAADVDYTAVTGGYDAGYSTSEVAITCFAHHYSQTVDGELDGSPIVIEDAYDASHFVAGHKIKIIERDPIDLTAPVIWERIAASQTGNVIVLTAALSSPAWDNTKKYRVVFNDYDVIVSAQQAWVFSASSVDGLIQDTAQPYLYGSGTPAGAYEANIAMSAAELVELVPDIIPLDGAGRDVGYEKQIARLADATIDYKTTSSPVLFNQVLTNTTLLGTTTFGFQLVAAVPIFLTWELLSGSVRREISVAPMFRSADGRPVFIRISIYRNAPTASTLDDQSPGTIYDGVVFETTSTTWVIPSPDVLFAEIKDLFGMCWLQIECSYMCETWGLARFHEGARST